MPIHVVAELGVNFSDINMAYEMIKASKEAGANFCKFQLFDESVIADSPLHDRLVPLILSESQVELLHNYAKDKGIGFILTPMYLEAIDIAAKYCDFIKIRYKDHDNMPLIEKALDTGKTLLISAPHKLVDAFAKRPYHPRMKALYNLPSYPPREEDFNLDQACSMDGISSHFPHTVCDLACAINRLQDEYFIEKHVMFKNRFIETHGASDDKMIDLNYHPIDEVVSIDFASLKTFISDLQLIEKIKRTRI